MAGDVKKGEYLFQVIDAPPPEAEPIALGGRPEARLFMRVARAGRPEIVFALRPSDRSECWAFADGVWWGGMFFIGFAERVYAVRTDGAEVAAIDLGDYFCAFTPGDEFLLVATGLRVLRIGPDGRLVWRSDVLGIDGVVIDTVEGGIIRGAMQHDPPDGWLDFAIALSDGTMADAGSHRVRQA